MIELGSSQLTQADLERIIFLNTPLQLAPHVSPKIDRIYQLIKHAAESEEAFYGINTGFGAMAEVKISVNDQQRLQKNIILSHAVGVGDPLDFHIAKTITLLRLTTLIQGYSAASPKLIDHLVKLINANGAPFIPKKGSVGASGDLAPLAHLGLLLLGIGDAFIDQKLVSASAVLKHAGLEPLTLGLRDGLALINGTQAMTASAIVMLREAFYLSDIADLTAALTLDAFLGHKEAFDERIQALKPHPGQIRTAKNIKNILSAERGFKNSLTQDPYSLRCVPQVHGATKDVLSHVLEITYREANAVTDNPLIFTDESYQHFEILSGGNFHGQQMAFALDYLALGMAELANISERRLELLVNPKLSQGLPPFLIENSGINSGYMMLHVTATALVSENKILSHPASVDSIPTSGNREDHVSMGMNAANKLFTILTNTRTVLAIEIMAAYQAFDLRGHSPNNPRLARLYRSFRQKIPFRKEDGLYKDDLSSTLSWLNSVETKALIHEIINDNS